MLCVCMALRSLQTATLLAVSPVGHRGAQHSHRDNTIPAAPCSMSRLLTVFSPVFSSTRFLWPQRSKAGQLSAGLSKQLCPSKEPHNPSVLLSARAVTPGSTYLMVPECRSCHGAGDAIRDHSAWGFFSRCCGMFLHDGLKALCRHLAAHPHLQKCLLFSRRRLPAQLPFSLPGGVSEMTQLHSSCGILEFHKTFNASGCLTVKFISCFLSAFC